MTDHDEAIPLDLPLPEKAARLADRLFAHATLAAETPEWMEAFGALGSWLLGFAEASEEQMEVAQARLHGIRLRAVAPRSLANLKETE